MDGSLAAACERVCVCVPQSQWGGLDKATRVCVWQPGKASHRVCAEAAWKGHIPELWSETLPSKSCLSHHVLCTMFILRAEVRNLPQDLVVAVEESQPLKP